MRHLVLVMLASVLIGSASCGFKPGSPSYVVGGTVTGLTGTGLVLQDNAGDDLPVSGAGTFAFPTKLAPGAAYAVTVKAQPSSPSQACTVDHGTGTVASDVTDVAITCKTTAYPVGGGASGLTGAGLVLQDNGGDDLAVSANGTFAFATPIASGAPYAVTILSHPTGQHCALTNATGTVGNGPVTSVTVSCAVDTFLIGGTVTGLAGTLVLRDNGGDDLTLTTNGPFSFATALATGKTYSVSVLTQPSAPSQHCVVSNASGVVATSDVANVTVTCTTDTFTIGGAVTGLAGHGLVLQDNGGDNITITADGAFTFPTKVTSGQAYVVTVLTQPTNPAQTCSLTGDTGTVGAANVTTVAITCTTSTFAIAGTVSGLSGTGLVLQNNAGDNLPVAANGTFIFATSLPSGAAYKVTVLTQPTSPAQTCVVSGGTGTVGTGPVTSVVVNCAANTYTVGGTVTGLAGTVVLTNNGADTITLSSNGTFAFATPIVSGGAYNVVVTTQPSSPVQTCTVTGGFGTVTANVTTVAVSCATATYTVGVTVSGLSGAGLILQDNAASPLAVPANGSYTFATVIASGGTYSVTVKTQPTGPSQTCVVTAGTGAVTNANITGIAVTCTTNTYTVGGTATGLTGSGLVLQDNGGDNLAVTGPGTFAFTTKVASGQPYAVTILTQPTSPSQTCVVTAGSGTVTSANVSVTVTCTTNTYAIGGTVSGLAGAGLVLQDNGGDNLAISANGAFTFATQVASGSAYAVTVLTPPSAPTQNCVVTMGSGTVGAAAISTVAVTCTTATYTIGGTVAGLAGAGLTLQDNGGDNLLVSASGTFTFATPIASGGIYAVAVASQPMGPSQTCTVSGGTGSVTSGNVTTVAITCTTNSFLISGTVGGLLGNGLVLQDNNGDDLPIASYGGFSFVTHIVSGATYNVTVKTQPTSPSQTCVVTMGSGTVTTIDVTTVTVTCTTNNYMVTGTLSGLAGTGLALQNNGVDTIMPTMNGAFSFPTALPSGATYAVTVLTQPTSPTQTCVVTGGSGTLTSGNATVTVTCTTDTFTVGGTVSGLAGAGLVLHNGIDALPIAASGGFTFPTKVASGATYAVTVQTQPNTPTQSCLVTNGSGTVGGANVTNVSISCTTSSFTVGGTVTGLAGSGLVLQNNGAGNLSVAASGSFTFATPLLSGATYNVTILTQPTGPAQVCTVTSGSGTVTSANVTGVVINCSTTSFTVGGTVTGLGGTGLVLQNNAGDNLPISANGSFTFATPLNSGSTYAVTVLTQPSSPTQTCTVTAGSGTVTSAAITTETVTCVTNTYSISATVAGLAGTGLVLQDNGGNNLTVAANGTATFTTKIASGAAYAVTVLTQPSTPTQTCSVTGGSGVVGAANVTSVAVTCVTNTYTVGGTITGLAGSGLVLRNNGGDDLTVTSGAATFTFATPVASGTAYAVTVFTNPSALTQTCVVATGSGTVTNANITGAKITCTTSSFTVGGSVTGLTTGTVSVQNNGAGTIAKTTNTAFTFATPIASGGAYKVTISGQPNTLGCTVSNGTGTVTNANITNVTITCAPLAWTSVATGADHTCGIKSDGTLWCWGSNGSSQLGDGTTTQRTVPTKIGAVITWSQVAAGGSHTCATRTDGTLWCWGLNSNGQLGDGTTNLRNAPRQVGALTTWVSVTAGATHSCAINNLHALSCWGLNTNGQLGDTTTTQRTAPVAVAGTWATVAAGTSYTCGTKTDGSLACWGLGTGGVLGDGNAAAHNVTAPLVVGLVTTWRAVSAGANFACATRTDDSAWCWGANASGQLGDGTMTTATAPVAFDMASTYSDIGTGGAATCAIRVDGSLWCIGSDASGQIGDGATTTTGMLTHIGSATTWAQISGGTAYACGTRTDNSLWCWGDNTVGQIGDNSTTQRTAPVSIPP